MKTHTTQEIIKKVQEIFDAEHEKHYIMGWEKNGCIKVEENTGTSVSIVISCMYGAPSPTLEVMTKLSNFFETKNINDDTYFSIEGCKTCDYGSLYGYTLTIRPEKENVQS